MLWTTNMSELMSEHEFMSVLEISNENKHLWEPFWTTSKIVWRRDRYFPNHCT